MTNIEEQIRDEDQTTDIETAIQENAVDADDVQIEESYDADDDTGDGFIPGTRQTPVQRLLSGEQKSEGQVSLIQEQGRLEGGGTLQMTGLFAEVNPIADEPEPEFVGKRSAFIHDEPGVSPVRLQAKDTPDGVKTNDGNKKTDDLDLDELDEDRRDKIRSTNNTFRQDHEDEVSREDRRDQEMSDDAKRPTRAQVFEVEPEVRDRQVAQASAVEDGGAVEEERVSERDEEQAEVPSPNVEDHERDLSTVTGYDEDARRAELNKLTKDDLADEYGVSDDQKKDAMIDEIIESEKASA